jgi:hypothetical protein
MYGTVFFVHVGEKLSYQYSWMVWNHFFELKKK